MSVSPTQVVNPGSFLHDAVCGMTTGIPLLGPLINSTILQGNCSDSSSAQQSQQMLTPGGAGSLFPKIDLMGTPTAPGVIPQTLLGLLGIGLLAVGAIGMIGLGTTVEVAAPETTPIVQATSNVQRVRAARQYAASKRAAKES